MSEKMQALRVSKSFEQISNPPPKSVRAPGEKSDRRKAIEDATASLAGATAVTADGVEASH